MDQIFDESQKILYWWNFWGFFSNDNFSEKLGSVSFCPLRTSTLKENFRKILWAVFEKNWQLTNQPTVKSSFIGPFQLQVRFCNLPWATYFFSIVSWSFVLGYFQHCSMYQTVLQFIWHFKQIWTWGCIRISSISIRSMYRDFLFVSYLYTCKTFGGVKLLDSCKTFGGITYIGNLHSTVSGTSS